MNVPRWLWLLTIGLTTALLLVDVVVIGRRPHVPSMREVGRHLGAYIALAVLFGQGVWYFSGPDYAAQFYAGWLTEYSLSVDNLFVFLVIMARFSVPARLQQTALMVGIVIALMLRGVFIAIGAAVINQYAWVFYVFGAFLIYTAVTVARDDHGDTRPDDPGDPEHEQVSGEASLSGETGVGASAGSAGGDRYKENAVLRWVGRRLPATAEFHGTRLVVREHGARVVTPMFLVILALGTTDLLFALDSIPAIYGLTNEPFLVLTANIFALMGLRQLYFLIGGLLKRLVYLRWGLGVLLAFIGVKLVLHAMHENSLPFVAGGRPIGWAPEVPIWLSLVVIVAILSGTTVASLLSTGRRQRAEPGARERV